MQSVLYSVTYLLLTGLVGKLQCYEKKSKTVFNNIKRFTSKGRDVYPLDE